MTSTEPILELYSAAAVRALDLLAGARDGISEEALMTRAGEAALAELLRRWPGCGRITVVCGRGNNAGDGYVVASRARVQGLDVRVVQLSASTKLSLHARASYKAMCAQGVVPESDLKSIDAADILVDAICGTGLNRDVTGGFARAIERINDANVPVLSLDIPSGLHPDTGCSLGVAVRAWATITFIGVKRGLFTGDGPNYTGAVVFDDLGITSATKQQVRAQALLLDRSYLDTRLTPRARSAHKGSHGHVLLIGGAPGFSGAIRLAAQGAARAGSGLVSIATHPEVAFGVNLQQPELMVHGVGEPNDLNTLLERANVVAIGPGLGQSGWAQALMAKVLEHRLPLVVDADALNLLAVEPAQYPHWILTPHPGEAARLLGSSVAIVNGDRFAAAEQLQQKFGGCVVLKGAGSIVEDGQLTAVVRAGNPGMGSGGMGDVLTGVIAGLLAQGQRLGDAARLGACIHALAGDLASIDGERGMLASDLMPHIRRLVNLLE